MNPERPSPEILSRSLSEFEPDLAVRVLKEGKIPPAETETRLHFLRAVLNNFLEHARQ